MKLGINTAAFNIDFRIQININFFKIKLKWIKINYIHKWSKVN